MSRSIKENRSASDPDETTALLAISKLDPKIPPNEEGIVQETSSNGPGPEDDDDKPLPRTQMFLLCYCRLVEPIAFFSIFPFINKMIWETGGLDQEDVGFYSGLIMLLMISWGHAADRYGRKPVLVFSLAGVAVATALFGFSKTIWQMIMFRCLAGVFAGSIVTIRAMISENSTHKTQARAFSFFAFTGNLGIFLGPLLGGALVDPAEQYPRVFGGIHFFVQFPYALPTICSGIVGASAALVSWLFINEVYLPIQLHLFYTRWSKTTDVATQTLDAKGFDKSSENPPMSIQNLVMSPGVPIVLLLYGYVMMLAFFYTAVAPVFFFTDIKLGGYGFTPLQISLFMALGGLSQAVWLLLVFPPLQRRIGTGGVLRACAVVWPMLFFVIAAGNAFLRQGWNLTFWIVEPINVAIGSGVAMAFTAVQLALNDVAPSPSTLGTLNAVALTLTSGIRAVTPAASASLFAVGARTQILNGYLVWLVLILIALGLAPPLRWLPEKAEGRLKKQGGSSSD
ncbi:MAG: hypothetical protein MMC33_002728 [Icmadophila ericetorum]|nr:hypothetical protein [Icmadophila ericetorum]